MFNKIVRKLEKAGFELERTLRKNGELNEKYPDGIGGQKLLLELEGHFVIQKGKRYFVKDYNNSLYKI